MQSANTTNEAIAIVKFQVEQGINVDSYTYVDVLKRCLKEKDLRVAREVHCCIIKSRMEQDKYVASRLLSVYIRCGSLQDARQVFDALAKKSVINWNVMIGGYVQHNRGKDAMQLFHQMRQEHVQADKITYLNILKACASPLSLKWGREVHVLIRRDGLESDIRVGTALIQMYAKCGRIEEAREAFDNLTNRNVVSWTAMVGAYALSGSIGSMKVGDIVTWNVMIGAYAGSGRGVEAYDLYLKMKEEGFQPDAVTYVSLLNDCASTGALEWVKEVHSHILEAGYESDVRVGSALIHMYAKCGSIEDAAVVFDSMKERDIITWTLMIGAYAGSGRGVEAYDLYLKMKEEGFQPDAVTYMSLLNDCGSAGALEWVKDVHRHILEEGHESDVRVGSALVHMYAKSGSIEDAQLVFERMEECNVMTWNIMIGGLGQHGRGQDALELFRKTKADGLVPDAYSFVALLSSCSHAGLVDEGRQIFCAMKDYGVEPTVVHYSCMVDLLGRAGLLEETKRFISSMPVEADAGTWGALLGACRTYGNVELGELAAKEVLKLEPAGASPYVLLSNIYAAAGQWDQVSFIRYMMQERGICKEPGVNWIEISNKVHRFVVGDKSHPEAQKIYDVLNNLFKKLKAEGYIPDTRLVLRNIDEEQKVHALWAHSEKLAIAYGLMHTPRGMPIRVYKNLRVCSDCHTATGFISKVTGREIVTRDANRFHHFKDGVCSCGDHW